LHNDEHHIQIVRQADWPILARGALGKQDAANLTHPFCPNSSALIRLAQSGPTYFVGYTINFLYLSCQAFGLHEI